MKDKRNSRDEGLVWPMKWTLSLSFERGTWSLVSDSAPTPILFPFKVHQEVALEWTHCTVTKPWQKLSRVRAVHVASEIINGAIIAYFLPLICLLCNLFTKPPFSPWVCLVRANQVYHIGLNHNSHIKRVFPSVLGNIRGQEKCGKFEKQYIK